MTLRCDIDDETLQDLINIETGVLAPLDGFMGSDDFISVVDNMVLADGETVWTIPITLDIDQKTFRQCKHGMIIALYSDGIHRADLKVKDCFLLNDEHLERVFRTTDPVHPGVAKEKSRFPYRVGGIISVIDQSILEGALNPDETKTCFKNMGWTTVAGFQTRNPIHNAHEHLQRLALDLCDGLFINPITGWKKRGDFTEEAVVTAYQKMISEFYPSNRVYFAGLKTQMRYAGPREAIFHAIIRKNLGCTHFIIGRDHAGVGGFYGPYDAHVLARQIQETHELGIELLLFNEPYYCSKCGFIVSNKTCAHYDTHRIEVSGTIIRECMDMKRLPPEQLMRPEISGELINLEQIFIK